MKNQYLKNPLRSLLASLIALTVVFALPVKTAGAAERKTIVVLTNHNDDTLALFEEAFEKAQPRYRIKLVWLMPPDAMKMLRREDSDTPDVWWQAAPHNHLADLAKDDIMQPLGIAAEGLPDVIGNVPLVDDKGLYRATQLTAFAFLINRQAIAEQHLPWPADWTVLAQPEYAGKVAISDPAKIRFGNTVLDVALQGYGWDKGWAMLSAIAGNAVLMPNGLTDEVSSGRQPVALHLDIVPNAEQRYREPPELVYPLHGGIVGAGYIGILKRTKQIEGARAFVSFVLSDAGQRLMTHTDLPRLPVRPAVYAGLGKDQFNPFAAQDAGQFTFKLGDIGSTGTQSGRQTLLAPLFAALTADQPQLAKLWARLHKAEQQAKPEYSSKVAAARHALEQVPLTEAQADSDEIKQAFRPVKDKDGKNTQSEAAKKYAADWVEVYRKNQVQAARLLDEVGA
jgi:ABC-type Fe3+ transport system substrate-binding protein